MAKIAIVTDSNSGITQTQAKEMFNAHNALVSNFFHGRNGILPVDITGHRHLMRIVANVVMHMGTLNQRSKFADPVGRFMLELNEGMTEIPTTHGAFAVERVDNI